LATQELTSVLRFVPVGPHGLRLDVAADVQERPAWLALATLARPPQATFEAQIPLVLAYADLREERLPEILSQVDSTLPTWSTLLPLTSPRLRRTRELLEVAVQMSMFIEMRFKHDFGCWRPMDLSWQVQPMIGTPGHGSLPSGHATESYVVATVLKALLGLHDQGDSSADASCCGLLDRTAARIATNRVVAGVHFPVDSAAGQVLGLSLGEYVVARCTGTRGWQPRAFHGAAYPGDADFDGRPHARWCEVQDHVAPVAASPVLRALWQRARAELLQLNLPLA
jgi:membrane-associated phospholipid phosphatase